jgi:hypothetical protein
MQWVQGQILSGGFARAALDIPDLRNPGARRSATAVQASVISALANAVANRPAPNGGVDFTLPNFFRSTIRQPIHRYLANPNVYGTTGDFAELGLGLGEYSDATDEFSPTFEINASSHARSFIPVLDPAIAWRGAWFLGEVVKYISWWSSPPIRNFPRLTNAQRTAINRFPNPRTWDDIAVLENLVPGNLRDPGIGVGMLWSLKRMIATLMAIRDDDLRPAFLFLGDA